jgi:hypothetical protein
MSHFQFPVDPKDLALAHVQVAIDDIRTGLIPNAVAELEYAAQQLRNLTTEPIPRVIPEHGTGLKTNSDFARRAASVDSVSTKTCGGCLGYGRVHIEGEGWRSCPHCKGDGTCNL